MDDAVIVLCSKACYLQDTLCTTVFELPVVVSYKLNNLYFWLFQERVDIHVANQKRNIFEGIFRSEKNQSRRFSHFDRNRFSYAEEMALLEDIHVQFDISAFYVSIYILFSTWSLRYICMMGKRVHSRIKVHFVPTFFNNLLIVFVSTF